MAAAGKKGSQKGINKILVMEKLLLFIKHRLGFLWKIIEAVNNSLFGLIYGSQLKKTLPGVFADFSQGPFQYRELTGADAGRLFHLIGDQPESDLDYFRPHGFDQESIARQTKKVSFLMMGVFSDDTMVGYFFLRFFANRKCFVGRLIDKEYRGKGIGAVMNNIMYETAWRMNFRCLSTISRNNDAVMRAHSGNRHMIILKELNNDYLLVEFLPSENKADKLT